MSLKDLGWPTFLALASALICAVVAISYNAPEGGFHLWPLTVFGLATLSIAIAKTRRWLLLVLVPFILSPMWLILLLVTACFFGDCV